MVSLTDAGGAISGETSVTLTQEAASCIKACSLAMAIMGVDLTFIDI